MYSSIFSIPGLYSALCRALYSTSEYRALHSDVEYSAECRPGQPNTQLYIRMLNVALNIDLEGRIYRALHSDVEYGAE